MIGYSETQKGYRLFDLDTKTIFVSRGVDFRERIFPFRTRGVDDEDNLLFMPLIGVGGEHVQDDSETLTQSPQV